MSPRPAYPKIAEALRTRIGKGELAAGSPVPSEGTLCAEFGVARNTLRRALMELEREGLVKTVPGVGRVVCDPAVPTGQASDLLLDYRRIAAELRERIELGEYAAGARLPSEATLVKHYGVSRDTVRRAFTQLRAAGLVTSVQGKGWFVRRDAPRTGRTSQDVPGRVSRSGDVRP